MQYNDTFYVYDRFFGVVEFKYAIWIFQAAKGIAVATKVWQNKPELHKS